MEHNAKRLCARRISVLAVVWIVGGLASEVALGQVFEDDFESGALCGWSSYSCLANLDDVALRIVDEGASDQITVCVPPLAGVTSDCAFETCGELSGFCPLTVLLEDISLSLDSPAEFQFELAMAAEQTIDLDGFIGDCPVDVGGTATATLDLSLSAPCADTRLRFGAPLEWQVAEKFDLDGATFCSLAGQKFEGLLLQGIEATLSERYQDHLQGQTYCWLP